MTPREFLARRVADDPDFLAYPLAQYCAVEDVDDNELARRLGCPVERLVRLRLCLRPRDDSFWADVQEIAAHVAADADALAGIVREAEALDSMREGTLRSDLLLAARDREPADQDAAGSEDGDR